MKFKGELVFWRTILEGRGLRVGSDYDEEVHWLVKGFNLRQGYSKATVDMADKMKKQ
jgi:hypothetical protein